MRRVGARIGGEAGDAVADERGVADRQRVRGAGEDLQAGGRELGGQLLGVGGGDVPVVGAAISSSRSPNWLSTVASRGW